MRVASSLALITLGVAVASADPTADDYFKQGRELLKSRKYAEACAQFEKSQQLDPALGTLYNIAQCDAEIGKLASALAAYREVVAHDTNATRKKASADAAKQLDARVPRLIVKAESGVTLSLDHNPLAIDTPTPLDLGKHEIVATQAGHAEFRKTVVMTDEAQVVTINAKPVPEVATMPGEPARTEPKPPEPVVERPVAPPAPAPVSHRKTYAIATMAVGGAALGSGLVFGALARSKWSDAKKVCGNSQTCATADDEIAAESLSQKARSRATLSTTFMFAGGVIGAVGIVLYATAPTTNHEVRVTVRTTGDGGGLALSGIF